MCSDAATPSSAGVTELRGIATTLSDEVDTVSALLVKLLRTKDRYSNKMRKQCQRLTLVLKDYASQNGGFTHTHTHTHTYPPTHHTHRTAQ